MKVRFLKRYPFPENKFRFFLKGEKATVSDEFGRKAIRDKSAEEIIENKPPIRERNKVKIRGVWQQLPHNK